MASQQQTLSAEKLREIAIQLDTYDDIFSDFDPRPYSSRALSEDFLKEIRRHYLEDKRGRFEVHFTIPAPVRNVGDEALIKKRLREQFGIMVEQERSEIEKIKRRGYLYIAVGLAVLLADTFAMFALIQPSFIYQVLSIILVPAGWYGMFTGIGKVIDEPFLASDRKKVYEKFEKASYIFISEERK